MAAIRFDLNTIPGGDSNPGNGLTYTRSLDGSFVTVAPPYVFPDPEDYVLRSGDDMSGTLKSPKFVGNYDLEDLTDINTI